MLNSIQVKAADAFAACHGYTAAVVRIRNTSAVPIDYRVDGAISALAPGASVVIDTASSTSEIEVRRTDLSATPVNVLVDFGITAEESYELSTAAAAAAVAELSAKISTFSPASYGTIGVGGNDSAAFQAAINAAQVAGGVVDIPSGMFLVEDLSITHPFVTLVGRGIGATVLQSITGKTVIKLSGGIHDITFEGFTAKGTKTGNGCGIEILATALFAWKLRFDRVDFREHGGHGLNLRSAGDSFNITVNDCSADDNLLDGFRIENRLGTVLNNCYVFNVATGRAGYRLTGGGTLNGCNGITSSGGLWGRFGANGDTESDGQNSIPTVRLIACNIEDFRTDGIEFKGPVSIARFESCSFLSDDGLANQRAVNFTAGMVDGAAAEFLGTDLIAGAGASWANGTPIHVQTEPFGLLSDRANPSGYYSASGGFSVFGNNSPAPSALSSAGYGYTTRTFGGRTDIEFLTGFSLGNPIADGACRFWGNTAMPTTGSFPRDAFVLKVGPTTVEGSAGSRYTLLGWRRLTGGSGNVLNTDWVEVRCPTGT